MSKVKIVDIKDMINSEVKNYIKISFFENNYTYKGLIDFDDFGDKLFLNLPKSSVINHCYVMNELNGLDRALKDNATFPLVVYIDIDFKHQHQVDRFNEDLLKSNITKEQLMEKLSKDKNIWISGNSRNGEGIRIFFIVYNKLAHETKVQDYHQIHLENSKIILNYLDKKYGLKYYNDIHKDYIDRAPIRNMVLKTYPCLLNNYSVVNNDCNIIVYDKEIIERVVETDTNIKTLSYDNIDYIPIENYIHYDPRTLAAAKFSDGKSRKLFYDNFYRYYEGDGLKKELSSFDNFNKYLDKTTFKYSVEFKDNTSDLIDLINNPYDNDDDDDDDIDILKNTKVIPQFVYDNLPNLLKDMCNQFNDDRIRDIFLTSELTTLSSILPNVSGIYYNETIFANIYSFVIAAAGSGKSSIKYALHTLYDYIQDMKDTYRVELLNHTQSQSKNQPPKEKVLKLAGNSSSAVLLENLERNYGRGLIFESEADSIIESFKKEWGNYDENLRKAFQHEYIQSHRQTYSIDIEQPKLSVMISGTPKQMTSLIKSSENGLFSRFFYYIYETEDEFVNPFSSKIDLSIYFKNKSKDIFNLISYYENTPTNIELTLTQQNNFTDFFVEKTKELKVKHEADIISAIRRLGTMGFKLLILLTAIRNFENQTLFSNSTLKCSDIDLEIVFNLIETYSAHMEVVFVNLSSKENIVIKSNTKEELINFILSQKESFKRDIIFSYTEKLNISKRTAERVLKNLLDAKKIKKESRLLYKVT